jgi:hypothetical protein
MPLSSLICQQPLSPVGRLLGYGDLSSCAPISIHRVQNGSSKLAIVMECFGWAMLFDSGQVRVDWGRFIIIGAAHVAAYCKTWQRSRSTG